MKVPQIKRGTFFKKEKLMKKNRVKEYLPLYLMMLPGLLYLLINNYLPMTGIILAFPKLKFEMLLL